LEVEGTCEKIQELDLIDCQTYQLGNDGAEVQASPNVMEV